MQYETLTYEQQHRYAEGLDAELTAMLPTLIDAGTPPRREDPLVTRAVWVEGQGAIQATQPGPPSPTLPHTHRCATTVPQDPRDVPPHLKDAASGPALTCILLFQLTLIHTVRLTKLSRPELDLVGSADAPPSSPGGFAKIGRGQVVGYINSHKEKMRRMFPDEPIPRFQMSLDQKF
eukprot:GHVU01000549.1.p1 GENE.GHVU01000549.1~~GHVU01000549.1.p1  ORF type:complete len:177 (+),score=21.30 GHVU01000549.1:454-984(+)